MWQYNHTQNELYHYGVLGMRWGVRHDKQYRSEKKALKNEYKNREDKRLSRLTRDMNKIESKYIPSSLKQQILGPKLSDSDVKKIGELADKYNKGYKKSKASYNKKLNELKVKTANRLYPTTSKEANRRIQTMSTGKTLIQRTLMGSYGAMKYNQLRAENVSVGKSFYNAFMSDVASYMDNRDKREERDNLAVRRYLASKNKR